METRKVCIEVNITIEIDPEELEYDPPGGCWNPEADKLQKKVEELENYVEATCKNRSEVIEQMKQDADKWREIATALYKELNWFTGGYEAKKMYENATDNKNIKP